MNESDYKSRVIINVETVYKDLLERVLGMPLSKYLENEVEKKFNSLIQNNEIKKDVNLNKFLNDELMLEKNSVLILNDVYTLYTEWNIKSGILNVSKIKFCRFLRSLDEVVVKRGGGNIVKVYGLKLEDDWE